MWAYCSRPGIELQEPRWRWELSQQGERGDAEGEPALQAETSWSYGSAREPHSSQGAPEYDCDDEQNEFPVGSFHQMKGLLLFVSAVECMVAEGDNEDCWVFRLNSAQ